MNKRFIILIIIAIPLLIAWNNTAWGIWRYKLTIEIITPEGIKSGSAVRQVSSILNPVQKIVNMPGVRKSHVGVKGEAVVIDLGNRGIVFGLIGSNSEKELYDSFPIRGAGTSKGILYYNKTLKPGMKRPLTNLRARPKLVTFTDLTDPKSGKSVSYENMHEAFGEGVRFKSITVEITYDPITWGVVDEYLSETFWNDYRQLMKTSNILERRQYVSYSKFKRGK